MVIKSELDFLVWEYQGSNSLFVTWVFFWRKTGIHQLIHHISLFGTVLGVLCPQWCPHHLLPHWALLFLSFLSHVYSVLGHSCLVLFTHSLLGILFLPKETVSALRARILPLVFCAFTKLRLLSTWWLPVTMPHASNSYTWSKQCFLRSRLTYAPFGLPCAGDHRGGVSQAKRSLLTLGPLILLSGPLCYSQIPDSFLGISPVTHSLRPWCHWGLSWVWHY